MTKRRAASSRPTALRAITGNLIENVTAREIPQMVPARPWLTAGWRQSERPGCEEVVLKRQERI